MSQLLSVQYAQHFILHSLRHGLLTIRYDYHSMTITFTLSILGRVAALKACFGEAT